MNTTENLRFALQTEKVSTLLSRTVGPLNKKVTLVILYSSSLLTAGTADLLLDWKNRDILRLQVKETNLHLNNEPFSKI